MIGDINQNLLNYQTNNDTKKFLDIMTACNFLPLTTLPTRVTDSSSTLIDHIFYRSANNSKNNDFANCLTGIITVDIADHLANFVILLTRNNNLNNIERPLIRVFSAKK